MCICCMWVPSCSMPPHECLCPSESRTGVKAPRTGVGSCIKNCLLWMLGTQFGFSTGATSAIDHWVISPVKDFQF